jgi:hypothetical protein
VFEGGAEVRIRTIKPEWLDDERLVLASSDARVLSIALLLLSDDYGRGRANRVVLAARVFPGKIPETLANALDTLEKLNFVVLYEVDGQSYFAIRNWEKHQKVDKPGKPQIPAPPQNHSASLTPEKIRESLAKLPESLATDQDQDRDQDHIPAREPVFDAALGVPPPRLVPVDDTPTPSEVRRVLALFETEWTVAAGVPLGLVANRETQRAIELLRWAATARPSAPLEAIQEAAAAACSDAGFRRLGGPWAAFCAAPGRHLAGRARVASGPAAELLAQQQAATAEYDRAISEGRHGDASDWKRKGEEIAAKRRQLKAAERRASA